MYSLKALALAFLALDALTAVHAALYIIQPSQGSTCHGGQSCTLQWLDDGTSPLNSDIGITQVGLYTGDMQLVQSIAAVDVSTTQSTTFTPIPGAGPNSGKYYVAFTSTNLTINGTKYNAFSPFFQLDNMSGSFSSPLESATTSISIPSSLSLPASGSSETELSTITVGTLSTSLPPISGESTIPATTQTATDTASASSESLTASLSSASSASATAVASASSGLSTSRISTSSSATATSSAAGSTTSSVGASSSNGASPLRTISISLPLVGVLSLPFLLLL